MKEQKLTPQELKILKASLTEEEINIILAARKVKRVPSLVQQQKALVETYERILMMRSNVYILSQTIYQIKALLNSSENITAIDSLSKHRIKEKKQQFETMGRNINTIDDDLRAWEGNILARLEATDQSKAG